MRDKIDRIQVSYSRSYFLCDDRVFKARNSDNEDSSIGFGCRHAISRVPAESEAPRNKHIGQIGGYKKKSATSEILVYIRS